jgi:hypothetical protein
MKPQIATQIFRLRGAQLQPKGESIPRIDAKLLNRELTRIKSIFAATGQSLLRGKDFGHFLTALRFENPTSLERLCLNHVLFSRNV